MGDVIKGINTETADKFGEEEACAELKLRP